MSNRKSHAEVQALQVVLLEASIALQLLLFSTVLKRLALTTKTGEVKTNRGTFRAGQSRNSRQLVVPSRAKRTL